MFFLTNQSKVIFAQCCLLLTIRRSVIFVRDWQHINGEVKDEYYYYIMNIIVIVCGVLLRLVSQVVRNIRYINKLVYWYSVISRIQGDHSLGWAVWNSPPISLVTDPKWPLYVSKWRLLCPPTRHHTGNALEEFVKYIKNVLKLQSSSAVLYICSEYVNFQRWLSS